MLSCRKALQRHEPQPHTAGRILQRHESRPFTARANLQVGNDLPQFAKRFCKSAKLVCRFTIGFCKFTKLFCIKTGKNGSHCRKGREALLAEGRTQILPSLYKQTFRYHFVVYHRIMNALDYTERCDECSKWRTCCFGLLLEQCSPVSYLFGVIRCD